jgi:hypothetical protein
MGRKSGAAADTNGVSETARQRADTRPRPQSELAFLPDVVRYQPGARAVFEPGGGNGRALDDDSFDIAVQFLAGSRLGNASSPRSATAEFPYLSPPQPADLPVLADLFGLRCQRPEQAPSVGSHAA